MRFEVKAVRPGAGVVRLPVEAASAEDALAQIRSQGYAALSAASEDGWVPRGGRRRFSLVLFSQELLALLTAGLSLVEGLETLAEKEQHTEAGKVLRGLLEGLYAGMPLSATMGRQPAVFPPLFVASVRASERTGDLPEALARYVAYQSQVEVVRKKLVSASIYPLLLLGLGTVVVLFLMVYVVPRFSQVFSDAAVELPLLSRLLIEWGSFAAAHVEWIGAVVLVLLAAGASLMLQPAVRRAFVRQLWRIPALGERIQVYELARFYRTLGMVLRGGIPVVAALDMCGGLLSAGLQQGLQSARTAVEQGLSISQAFERSGLTTPVALRMLRVGERSGRIAEMMERIAAFYDEDMARWVDMFTRLFEPMLMVLIGVVIGGVVLLMYLPIFELAGGVQ